MMYLICRADQVPNSIDAHGGGESLATGMWYPRFVYAPSPEDAIDRAFSPEDYKPAGKRELVVIELGEIYEFVASPPPPRKYVLTRHTKSRKLRTW